MSDTVNFGGKKLTLFEEGFPPGDNLFILQPVASHQGQDLGGLRVAGDNQGPTNTKGQNFREEPEQSGTYQKRSNKNLNMETVSNLRREQRSKSLTVMLQRRQQELQREPNLS